MNWSIIDWRCCFNLCFSKFRVQVPSSTFSWKLDQFLTPNLLFVDFSLSEPLVSWQQIGSKIFHPAIPKLFHSFLCTSHEVSWIYFRFYFWHRKWKMISDHKITWRDRQTVPNSVLENSFSMKAKLSCETKTCRPVTAELRLPLFRNKMAERRGR